MSNKKLKDYNNLSEKDNNNKLRKLNKNKEEDYKHNVMLNKSKDKENYNKTVEQDN